MENLDLKMSSQSVPSGLCNYSDSDSDESSHHKEKPFKRTFNYSSTPADGQPILMRRDVVHSKEGRKVPVSILKSSKKKLPAPELLEQTTQPVTSDAQTSESLSNHRIEPVASEESKLNGCTPISFVLNSTHRHNSVNVLEEVDSQKKNNSKCTQTETFLLESKKFFKLSYDLQMAKKKYSFVAVENLASVNIDSEHGWLEMLVGQLKIRDKIISELNKKVLEMKSIGSSVEMDLDYLQLKVACSEEDNEKLREQMKSSENSTELNHSTNKIMTSESNLPLAIGFDINSIPLPEVSLPATCCVAESSSVTNDRSASIQSLPKQSSTVSDTKVTSETNVSMNGSGTVVETGTTDTRRERRESGGSCISVEMIEPPPKEPKTIETVTLDEESSKEVPLEELLRLKKLEILRVHEREEAKRVAKEKERVEQQKKTLDKLKQVDAAKRKRSPSCDKKKNKGDVSVQNSKKFRSSSQEKSRQSLSNDRKQRSNSKERKRKSVSKDRRRRSRSFNKNRSPSQDRQNYRSRSKDRRKRSPSKEKRKRSSSVSKKSNSPSRNSKHKKADKKRHRSPTKESKTASELFKVHNKNVEEEADKSSKKSKKTHRKKQKKEKKSKKKSTKKAKSSKRSKKKHKESSKNSSSVEKEIKSNEVSQTENGSEEIVGINKLDSNSKVNGSTEKGSKSADSIGEASEDSSSSSSDSSSDESPKVAPHSISPSDGVPINSTEEGKEKPVEDEGSDVKESSNEEQSVNQPDKEYLESQNFKFLPEFQLYFNSETGFYYDSVTRIYYDSKSCTYCYYDDVALEYRYTAKVSESHARNFALLLHSLKEWQKKEQEQEGYDSATISAEPQLKDKGKDQNSLNVKDNTSEKKVESDILTYEETLRQRIASRLLERKKPSDQPPEEDKEEDVSPSTRQFERDYAQHLEHKEMMSGGMDIGSIAPSLRLMLVGFGPSSSLPKVSSVSLPPILPPTGQKNSKRIESLHIVTVDGATVGRLSKSGVHVPHISVSKEHASIVYECSGVSDHKYYIKDMGSNNGTYVNGHRLSATKTPSKNHEIGHNWLINIGEVQFQVHIHPGNSTCNNCEPGLTAVTVENNITEKPDNEESRRNTEKVLRKKYGLGHHGVDNSCSDFVSSSQNYSDRAEGRRVLKGSDNPYEKTQVVSVDESLHSSNKGYKLLKKMGWGEGEGLGKDSDGIKDPVLADGRAVGVGLGSDGNIEKPPSSKERIRSVTKRRYDNK